MRKVIGVLLVFVCFILQSSVFTHFTSGGIVPNLLIIYTSCIGFMRGEKSGMLVGFLCGILYDVLFGEFIGFFALLYLYIGFVNGKFCGIFYPEDIKLPVGLIILSDLTYGIICYVFLFLVRGRLNFPFYFTKIILPEMFYTICSTIILYPLVLAISQLLEKREKRGAQKFV